MSVTIKDAVEAYVLSKNKKHSKFSKKIVINLLIGVNENNKKIDVEKDFAFLSQDGLNTELSYEKYNILPSLTISQAILETGWLQFVFLYSHLMNLEKQYHKNIFLLHH